ncbi:hypothetical protein AB0950_02325 [Streptomyces sp. NPDC007189]|uniref:hypothetical protein n=1 Tax=Streptomyces sp. NPDC007189 TaxID=3154315 RepID=UPI003456FB2B
MSSFLISPAALLGTSVRVLRTAAGRRALQLVLLVGGLFTLGFLCGEQAHAADGTPLPAQMTSAAGRPGPSGHADPARAAQVVRAAGAEQAVHGAGAAQVVHAVPAVQGVPAVPPVRTVSEPLAGPVVRRVGVKAAIPVQAVSSVRDSVRDVLTAVSRAVEETAGRAVSGQPRTTAPSLPLPDLAPVTDVPVQVTPEPMSAPPSRQRDVGAAVSGPAEERGRHAGAGGRAAVGAPASAVVYGPGGAEVPQPVAYIGARYSAAAAAAVPERPVPTGDPDGVLGKPAADGSASRHGDAHAVTLGDRASVRLAPGATARVDAPRPRERHRDILVFPG